MTGNPEASSGTPNENNPDSTVKAAEGPLAAACEFQGLAIQAREKCREEFRRSEREVDNNLRISVDGQIAALVATLSRRFAKVDETISYQIGITASFARTHFIVTDLILNGDLVEAITLIRKQLESLARLHELDSKPLEKLHGRTPNIGILFRNGGGEFYGHLSEVAHFSKPRVAELMRVIQAGERISPSLLPEFTDHSFACLDMNHFVAIYFLGWITEKLSEWYLDADYAGERRLFSMTLAYAEKIGVIRFPDRPNTMLN